jgi:hypothetical protein
MMSSESDETQTKKPQAVLSCRHRPTLVWAAMEAAQGAFVCLANQFMRI